MFKKIKIPKLNQEQKAYYFIIFMCLLTMGMTACQSNAEFYHKQIHDLEAKLNQCQTEKRAMGRRLQLLEMNRSVEHSKKLMNDLHQSQ